MIDMKKDSAWDIATVNIHGHQIAIEYCMLTSDILEWDLCSISNQGDGIDKQHIYERKLLGFFLRQYFCAWIDSECKRDNFYKRINNDEIPEEIQNWHEPPF